MGAFWLGSGVGAELPDEARALLPGSVHIGTYVLGGGTGEDMPHVSIDFLEVVANGVRITPELASQFEL